jgi:hypothetical protein
VGLHNVCSSARKVRRLSAARGMPLSGNPAAFGVHDGGFSRDGVSYLSFSLVGVLYLLPYKGFGSGARRIARESTDTCWWMLLTPDVHGLLGHRSLLLRGCGDDCVPTYRK